MNKGFSATSLDIFRRGLVAKIISALTTFFFTFVFYLNPASLVVAEELTKDQKRDAAITAALEATPEQKLSHRMAKLYDKVQHELPRDMLKREQQKGWFKKTLANVLGENPISKEEINELRQLKTDAEEAYKEAMANFEQEAKELTSTATANGKSLTPETRKLVFARHREALTHIQNRYTKTTNLLNAVLSATTADKQRSALAALTKDFKQDQFKPTHTPATPNKLPWGTPKADVRAPVDTPAELQAALGLDPMAHYAKLAQIGDVDPGQVAQAMANAANVELQKALGESVEVQLTPEIKALAQSLNNNSTEIYAWVHNTIKFIPSYGSIQGAQHTLETKQGNAVDTASLLIALLRAAKIPARYAYGTVEIPADKVMNWVGGATLPEAAQSILGQGGIPTISMVSGGKVQSFKMEHVWVEAFVDYFPSRGMVEKTGDSWIPMDPSFKQYEFSEGMNLKEAVPFDPQALIDDIVQKSIINEEHGWLQNSPADNLTQQLHQYQTQLKTYVDTQNPIATVDDVLSTAEIAIIPPRPLAAGLPYKRIVTSQTFIEVPDSLRHKFKYDLATQINGYPGGAFIQIEEPTAKLAGKMLALSFKPATGADEAIMASHLPPLDTNGHLDPKSQPRSLPGYLIKMTAEVTLDGQVIAQGDAGHLGAELHEELGLSNPKDGWEISVNQPSAGQYRAIGLDLQGISLDQANRLKASLKNTQSKLTGHTPTQLASITRHDLVGDVLQGVLLNYFSLNDQQDSLAAQSAGVITYRLPSFGTASTSLQTQYWFGVARKVNFTGVNIDIDQIKFHHVAQNNNTDEGVMFTQIIGARMSAMEHQVPEEIFSTNGVRLQGVSAIKALNLATVQGQKIWKITSANVDIALSTIDLLADTETEIRNAVNAGKIVTAHEAKINVDGWIGEGYILLDPETGAGAYKIAGGANGGELPMKLFVAGPAAAVGLVTATAPALMLIPSPDGNEIATFFGEVECEMSQTAKNVVLALAISALILIAARMIRAARLLPELGLNAREMIRTVVISALSMTGVEDAEAAYERDCECASGIYGRAIDGVRQCWICSVESEPVIRNRVKIAKNNIRGKSCRRPEISKAAALVTIIALNEAIEARNAENICWDPRDPDHVEQVENHRNAIVICESILRGEN